MSLLAACNKRRVRLGQIHVGDIRRYFQIPVISRYHLPIIAFLFIEQFVGLGQILFLISECGYLIKL